MTVEDLRKGLLTQKYIGILAGIILECEDDPNMLEEFRSALLEVYRVIEGTIAEDGKTYSISEIVVGMEIKDDGDFWLYGEHGRCYKDSDVGRLIAELRELREEVKIDICDKCLEEGAAKAREKSEADLKELRAQCKAQQAAIELSEGDYELGKTHERERITKEIEAIVCGTQ